MPRDELLSRTSSRELTEWMAYEAVEPFPAQRLEAHLAQVAMLIANTNRDATKHPQPFTLADFLLFTERREPTPDEIAERNARLLEGLA